METQRSDWLTVLLSVGSRSLDASILSPESTDKQDLLHLARKSAVGQEVTSGMSVDREVTREVRCGARLH